MAGSVLGSQAAGPRILRAGRGEDGRTPVTFPSIVPSQARSKCCKLLKGLMQARSKAAVLECGENIAIEIFFSVIVVSNQELEKQMGFLYSQLLDG